MIFPYISKPQSGNNSYLARHLGCPSAERPERTRTRLALTVVPVPRACSCSCLLLLRTRASCRALRAYVPTCLHSLFLAKSDPHRDPRAINHKEEEEAYVLTCIQALETVARTRKLYTFSESYIRSESFCKSQNE